MTHLVLSIHSDPLLHQVPDHSAVSLPGCPVHCIVSLHIHCPQVSSVTIQHLQHLQSAQTSSDMNPALSMLVSLVHINISNIEQLLQTRLVVLFNSTEDGGEYKVIIL